MRLWIPLLVAAAVVVWVLALRTPDPAGPGLPAAPPEFEQPAPATAPMRDPMAPAGEPGPSLESAPAAGAEPAPEAQVAPIDESAGGDALSDEEADLRELAELVAADGLGLLAGSIVLQGDLARWGATVECRSGRQGTGSRVEAEGDDVRSGRFSVMLEAGRPWELQVLCDPCEHPLFALSGIEVAPGQVLRPAELQELELNHFDPVAELDVRDREGKLLPWVRVGDTQTDENGVAALVLCDGPREVEVHRQGYRSRSLTVSSGLVVVTLDPALPVELCLPEGLRVPEGWRLGATPFHGTLAATGRVVEFDDAGRVSFTVPEPRRYRLVWSLRPVDGRKPVFLETPFGATTQVLVEDRQDVQRFGVEISEAVLLAESGRLEREGDR